MSKKNSTPKPPKPTFREWYEKKFGIKLPLYLENAQKRARMAEYKKEVGDDTLS